MIREGLRALEEGTPKLLFLGTPEELEGTARAGVVTSRSRARAREPWRSTWNPSCRSPTWSSIGRSPAVDALAGMATALGWRAVVIDDGGDPGATSRRRARRHVARPGRRRRRRPLVRGGGHAGPLRRGRPAARARHAGRLRRAGRLAQARRLGARLPARPRGRRGRARARPRARRARPGPRSRTRRSRSRSSPSSCSCARPGELAGAAPRSPPARQRHEEIDPVCGMTVDVATARLRHARYEGRTYYFCSAGCLERFEAAPAEFEPATSVTR